MSQHLRYFCAFVAVAASLLAPANALGACGQPPRTLPGTWCFVDGQHVRVWWKSSGLGGGVAEAQATTVRDEVETHIWPMFEILLGRQPPSDGDRRYRQNGGDGRYDIMLTPPERSRSGSTHPVPAVASVVPQAKFSMVESIGDARRLRGFVAHELMHGFLASYGCPQICDWLDEATATWAQHFAYPRDNTEHSFAGDFFGDPKLSLDEDPTSNKFHKYGAYVFLFYLQRRGGAGTGNAHLVRGIWEAAVIRNQSPLSAIDATVPNGLKGVWRDFVTANWNADPVLVGSGSARVPIYVAWDRMADGIENQKSLAGDYSARANPAGIPLSITLPHLSAAYYSFDFATDVRSVRVVHNMLALRGAGRAGAELVAFTKLKGSTEWTLEPRWDNENEHTFCRDRAGQRIEKLILAFGNADLAGQLDFVAGGNRPTVYATADSCLTGFIDGYEECKLEFLTSSYRSFETQTWELTGSSGVGQDPRILQYTWSTTGNGSASVRRSQSTSLSATWSILGIGTSELEVRSEPTPTGDQQVAVAHKRAISVSGGVIGSQILTISGTQQAPTAIRQTWNEYLRPKRTAALATPRIEGYSQGPLPGIWAAGVGQPPNVAGAVSCRWSWPGLTP